MTTEQIPLADEDHKVLFKAVEKVEKVFFFSFLSNIGIKFTSRFKLMYANRDVGGERQCRV